ncbi:MAG: Undecaprenyl-phosphate glucose phosphotransferase [Frankiales bacterium]|nr:Undecaprenyl-phosphate glucose phosphotransferase [Frankiales bacterium]
MTIFHDSDAIAVESMSRRGPMRPRRLVSVRANQSKRLSSHVFRAVDVIALVAVTAAVSAIQSPAHLVLSTSVRQILPLVLGALVLARALRALRLYRFERSNGIRAHLGQLAGALGMSIAVVFIASWLITDGPSNTVCWQWIGLAAIVLTALHTGWWLIVRAWQSAGWLTPNLVIVGATEYAERVIGDAIARRNVNVLGVFDDRLERSPKALLGVPVLGDIDALLSHKITPYVDRVVIAVEPSATKRVREIAARLAVLPNEVTLFLAPQESSSRTAALARLEDSALAELDGAADLDRKAFAKRAQDLLIGAPILILASPVLALIALLIKIDSRGPVFFRQRRHGFNNEEIVVWKFRSMRTDATDARAERQVSANDDRVTRLGRVLRKTSLDELPQLINVLRGEMSLVGPRPHAIGMKTGEVESARLVAEYAHRHRIKPGMTGWAAINGSRGPLHAAADVQQRVALDIDYIGRQSFRLDLRIMAMTVPGLLGDRHAVR